MRRVLLAVLLVALVMPASAGARYMAPERPLPGYGLDLASKRWPSKCSGVTRIIVQPVARPLIGLASGMRETWDGTQWVWHTEKCEMTVDPGLSPVVRCQTEIHEYLHLAFEQAAHVGVLGAPLKPLLDYLCGGRGRSKPRHVGQRQVARLSLSQRPRPAV